MDGYLQLKVLGKGSFGSAWLVQRKKDGQKFVAKEIRLAGLKPAEKESAKHEISMLQQLHHPNITSYVDHFETKTSLFIIMEYANGGDLHNKIKERRGQRFKEAEILHYFVQLCLALAHMHDQRVLHRDLKTMNVFLTQDGVVKLGDFGISTVLRNTYELKRTVCGTPYYFSPELCLNKPYNNKSDVWALGCILYELTTLQHAFEGNSMKALVTKILKGVYPPIHSSYSSDLGNLISAMLKTDPQRRPNIQQILQLPFLKDAMSRLKGDLAVANKDKKSLLDEEAKEKALQDAQERAVRAKLEQIAKEKQAAAEKQQRERDHQSRLEQMRQRLEAEKKEQEDRLRRIRDQQQLVNAQKQKEYEERIKARVAEERKYQAERHGAQIKREADWERNMEEMRRRQEREHEKERRPPSGDRDWPSPQQNANRPPPARQPSEPTSPAYDAAAVAREARREAAANKARALQVEEKERRQAIQQAENAGASPGLGLGKPPRRPSPPPVEPPKSAPQPTGAAAAAGGNAGAARRPMTEAEMEVARKEAYWQMRREAEANKRRLMGLDDLPAPAPTPAPVTATPPAVVQTPLPSKVPNKVDESPVVVKRDVSPAAQQPVPVPDKKPHRPPSGGQHGLSPPLAPSSNSPQPGAVDDDDWDDDGDNEGLHQFLNNEAAAEKDPDDRERSRQYDAVTACLDAQLNREDGGLDFDDPHSGGGDPSHFLLDGQTLHLPNSTCQDPLGQRIESLRLFLEHCLGDSTFIRVYRLLDQVNAAEDDVDRTSEAESLLAPPLRRYIPLVIQLIVCEDHFNSQQNPVNS